MSERVTQAMFATIDGYGREPNDRQVTLGFRTVDEASAFLSFISEVKHTWPALAARPASEALAMDVLRCIPADWKPGYGREWGNLGPILAEFIDDLREGRYPARPASGEPVACLTEEERDALKWLDRAANANLENERMATAMGDSANDRTFYRHAAARYRALFALLERLLTTPPAAAQDRERLEVTEDALADAMMAFNGWDADDEIPAETRATLRAHYLGDGIGKRDSQYHNVKRALNAAHAAGATDV